jgi:gliding motility-associated-like protein
LVEDHPPLALTINPTDVSCFGENDGMATAVVTGGVGNYTYTWSDGQTSGTAEGLAPGDYSVTVQDGNGCEIEGETSIIEPDLLTANIVDIADVFCFGEATGGITASAEGGSPSYEYSVDGVFFQASPQFTGLAAGTYTVYIQDDRDCIATVEATIIEPDQLIVNLGDDLAIKLGFDIQLNALVTPLGHQVIYTWTPPDSLSCIDCPDPDADPTGTITYTVVVTDSTGCAAADSITILVSKERPIYAPTAFSPDGDGVNDYFILFAGPAARSMRTLKVFDRWGELLFEGNNLPFGKTSIGWDGTFRDEPMGSAVYTWFAEIEFVDDEVIIYRGDITIVR